MVLLTTLLLTGCSTEDESAFSSGGQYNVHDFIEVDTGSSDTKDTADTLPEGTPSITSMSAVLEPDYAGFELALLVSVKYTDSDENVDGGFFRCLFEVDGGNEAYCATEDAGGNALNNGEIPIDGYNAVEDNGTVELSFDASAYEDATSIRVTAVLIDADGNESTELQVAAKGK